MKNNLFKFVLAFVLGLLALVVPAWATVPTEVTTMTTDIDTVWTTVKGIVIGFAAFSLLMFVVFKVRRRTG